MRYTPFPIGILYQQNATIKRLFGYNGVKIVLTGSNRNDYTLVAINISEYQLPPSFDVTYNQDILR